MRARTLRSPNRRERRAHAFALALALALANDNQQLGSRAAHLSWPALPVEWIAALGGCDTSLLRCCEARTLGLGRASGPEIRAARQFGAGERLKGERESPESMGARAEFDGAESFESDKFMGVASGLLQLLPARPTSSLSASAPAK